MTGNNLNKTIMKKNEIRVLENTNIIKGEAPYLIVNAGEIDDYSSDDELSDFLSDDQNEDAKRLFWNFWDGNNHKSEYIWLGSKSEEGLEWGDSEHIKWHLMNDFDEETEKIKDAYLRVRERYDYNKDYQEILDIQTDEIFVFSFRDGHGWLAEVY